MKDPMYLNAVSKHFGELAQATVAGVKKLQPSPMGTTPRSPKELRAAWARLQRLDRDEKEGLMDALASSVGHAMDEKEPCELCRFVTYNVAKDAAKDG